jgi:hypothetical protein
MIDDWWLMIDDWWLMIHDSWFMIHDSWIHEFMLMMMVDGWWWWLTPSACTDSDLFPADDTPLVVPLSPATLDAGKVRGAKRPRQARSQKASNHQAAARPRPAAKKQKQAECVHGERVAILFPMIGSETEVPEQEQWFSGTWHVGKSDKGGAAAVIFDDGDRLDIDSGGEWTFNGTWPFWNDAKGLRHSISTVQQLV